MGWDGDHGPCYHQGNFHQCPTEMSSLFSTESRKSLPKLLSSKQQSWHLQSKPNALNQIYEWPFGIHPIATLRFSIKPILKRQRVVMFMNWISNLPFLPGNPKVDLLWIKHYKILKSNVQYIKRNTWLKLNNTVDIGTYEVDFCWVRPLAYNEQQPSKVLVVKYLQDQHVPVFW